jgi:endonuclease/exonuclease/phosphatase family metal-dependent hydrolase
MSTHLRFVTWNIHKGIGTDRLYRLDRIVQVLGELDADVICLQEVDEGVFRSSYDSQAAMLSQALGYPHAALGLNVRVREGAYGNLTLSRWPIEDVRNVDLTVPPKKRRSGLVSCIRPVTDGQTWCVANVHLGLMHLERRIQVRWLLQHLFEDARPDQPLVIAGDWNEWGSRLVRAVTQEFGFHLARSAERASGERTFPSRRPLVALDKILYRDPVRCHAVACVLSEVTRVASDHQPLVVDLEAPKGKAEKKNPTGAADATSPAHP